MTLLSNSGDIILKQSLSRYKKDFEKEIVKIMEA